MEATATVIGIFDSIRRCGPMLTCIRAARSNVAKTLRAL